MSQNTPQLHIDQMNALALKLMEKHGNLIRRACIDDWGRNSNFVLFAWPVHGTRHFTAKVQAAVRKELQAGNIPAKIRECFAPDLKLQKATGYRAHWAIDIDYQQYQRATNTFTAAPSASPAI